MSDKNPNDPLPAPSIPESVSGLDPVAPSTRPAPVVSDSTAAEKPVVPSDAECLEMFMLTPGNQHPEHVYIGVVKRIMQNEREKVAMEGLSRAATNSSRVLTEHATKMQAELVALRTEAAERNSLAARADEKAGTDFDAAMKAIRNGPTEKAMEAYLKAKGLNAPRLDPAHIDSKIKSESYHVFPGTTMTVCALVLENGFVVIGESAAASMANFSVEIGQTIAKHNARQKVWALEDYLLREILSHREKGGVSDAG